MLYVYSDAASKGTKAVATTFIITEDTFITCFSNVYENVSSSVTAELLGTVQAMKYVYENCSDEVQVVVLIDNKSIVIKYIKVLSEWVVEEDDENKELYEQLLVYSEGFKINVQHIRGHQHTQNPNKVCDVISKVYLWKGEHP